MPGVKLTKRAIDAVAPGNADQLFWDQSLKGFGLKVTARGTKTYLVQYRIGGRGSPTKRVTIGRHGSPWTADTARGEAERILSQVAKGVDPQAVAREEHRVRVELAFDQYVDRYLEAYGRPSWRPRTYLSVKSNLARFVTPVLKDQALPSVSRIDLTRVFDALPKGKPALSRNVYAHTSKLFAWAVERGDIERSPFASLKAPPPAASRDRVLTDGELRRVWTASEGAGYPFGPMVRLLILTGQRRNEVAGLMWQELDRITAEWTIPSERAKNKSAHVVPLSAPAVAILDALAGGSTWPKQGLVFTTTGTTAASGHSRAKARLDNQMKMMESDSPAVPWRLHDLRRTMATGFQRLGVRFEVTEAVLNHVSGARSGVAGVYQRHNWREEKREALDRWAAHVTDLKPVTET